MPAVTTTIEPDEFLGPCASTDLAKMANSGEADLTGVAKTLMHGAVAAKPGEPGLPWAPSEEDVRRAARPAASAAKPLASTH
jgi:hypothetical protein